MNKKVRNINNITYRVLSFIFYSCVWYAATMYRINPEYLKGFYYEDDNEKKQPSLIYILIDIWNILNEELSKKGINNIQCFLNMIIPEISNLIVTNKKAMFSDEERNEFEKECNNVIEKCISEYNNYYITYIRNNQKLLDINDDTIESILEETSNLENFSNETYPLIKYFYATNYPNNETFMKQLMSLENPLEEYPVITNYISFISDNKDEIEFLENFENFNNLIVYVLNKYSNKYSREEAKKVIINDELNKDLYMKNLFIGFKETWENIYKILPRLDCNKKMKEKNITEEDSLDYILNDNVVNTNGRYIASAYKNFITIQNKFLKPFCEIKNSKDYLTPYIHQIKKEMMIQKCQINEIISFNVENEIIDSFDELVNAYSFRNCFNKNANLHYLRYKEIKYDLEAIEIELSKILLPGKKLLMEEKYQQFITYKFEGFSQNANIITDFKNKIVHEETLSYEEKSSIEKLIEKIDYKLILSNIQSLFLYFINKKNIMGQESLMNEIEHLPIRANIKLDEDFVRTIRFLQLDIKLSQLIEFYEYIEYLCFDKIMKNISKKAFVELTDEQKVELKKHFNNNDNLLISKEELGQAVRKLITRFLDNDDAIYFIWPINYFLKEKPELWDKKYLSDENISKFEEEMDEFEDIIVGQAVHLYEILEKKNVPYSINKTNKDKNGSKTKTSNNKSKKTSKKITLKY